MSRSTRIAIASLFATALAAAPLGALAQQPNIMEPAQSSGGGVGNIRSGEGAPARGSGTSGVKLPRSGDKSIMESAETSGGGAGTIRSREGAPARGAGTSGIKLPRSGDKSIMESAETSGGGAGNIRSREGAPPLTTGTTKAAPKAAPTSGTTRP